MRAREFERLRCPLGVEKPELPSECEARCLLRDLCLVRDGRLVKRRFVILSNPASSDLRRLGEGPQRSSVSLEYDSRVLALRSRGAEVVMPKLDISIGQAGVCGGVAYQLRFRNGANAARDALWGSSSSKGSSCTSGRAGADLLVKVVEEVRSDCSGIKGDDAMDELELEKRVVVVVEKHGVTGE